MKSLEKVLRKLFLVLSLGSPGCIDWDSLGIQPDAHLNLDSSIVSNDGTNNKTDAETAHDSSIGNCYRNDFTEPTSLSALTVENGLWNRHPDGYLRQIEEYESSWRKAHFSVGVFSDLEAKIKIRMVDSTNPSAGVNSNHTGILLRYNPETREGYVVQLQRSNMDTVQISLDDIGSGENIQDVTIDCGEIGCGYNNWYNLRVKMVENQMSVYLDDVEMFTTTNNQYTNGQIGFACYASGESHYDDLEVCKAE